MATTVRAPAVRAGPTLAARPIKVSVPSPAPANAGSARNIATRAAPSTAELRLDAGPLPVLNDAPLEQQRAISPARLEAAPQPRPSPPAVAAACHASSSSCTEATSDVASSVAADTSCAASCSGSRAGPRSSDSSHDSVCIKADTRVKDAAGAIVKVLNRLNNTLVTALRLEATHEALNRAVKAIAVARKYVKDQDPTHELSFLPFNRERGDGGQDPNRFAFLVFKTRMPSLELLEHDSTDLNVSHGSDPNAVANAIIRIVKERGQAVMKAGGCDAMWVAMTAVVNARRRLKQRFDSDVQLVPAWITEDTTAALGRVSKFIRFNLLPCSPNGPLELLPQVQPRGQHAQHAQQQQQQAQAQQQAALQCA